MAPGAQGKSLEGFVIAFAGAHTSFAEFKDKKIADLKYMITAHGGEYATKVTGDCTHLISTEDQYTKCGAKVTEANKQPDIKIVSYEWLSKSLLAKKKVDESPYIFASVDTDQATGNGLGLVDSEPPSDKRKRSRTAADTNDAHDGSVDKVDAAPASKKAKTSADDVPSLKKSKSKDGQKAKSASINVSVDEHYTLGGRSRVHIGDDGTIFDVTLNQTNAGNNNNKFYRIQLLVDDGGGTYTWTRWGRVGEKGQSKLLGDGDFDSAMQEFDKKFKDKNGNTWANRDQPAKSGKYAFIERNYEDSSNEEDDELPGAGKRRASKESLESAGSTKSIESKLPGPVQRLMKLIFNQQYFNDTMASLDYDANKMPLGKLSKRTLLQGYEVLKELAAIIGDPLAADLLEDRSNRYFSLIPHSFGRNRPPVLNSSAMIKKEIDLLETLTDMQLANDIMREAKNSDLEEINIMDRQFQGLGLKEMTPLDMGGSEFNQLQDYLIKSAGATHGFKYKVQDIFRIERNGEFERFGAYSNLKNSDRRLLWHGSRCTNFGGILSQGLRIAVPAAPVSGYMFGKGVYLADISTKSAGYCAHYTSGHIGLLLLCEAELGKPPLKLTDADYNAGDRAKEASCLSTWGVGQTAPAGWKDAGCVNEGLKGALMPDVSSPPGNAKEENAYLMYNEYIVYDVAQVRLRYLLRVEIR